MKTIFASAAFILMTGTVFSQECIQKYIGFYKINMEETIAEIRRTDAEKANEEVPAEFMEKMRKVKMEIKADALEMTMMEQTNEIKVIPRESKKEGGSCDLLLMVPPEQLPEGVEIPFLTIYANEYGKLMIKSSGGGNDMDSFVWTKVE
jgi:hypothetical protein